MQKRQQAREKIKQKRNHFLYEKKRISYKGNGEVRFSKGQGLFPIKDKDFFFFNNKNCNVPRTTPRRAEHKQHNRQGTGMIKNTVKATAPKPTTPKPITHNYK